MKKTLNERLVIVTLLLIGILYFLLSYFSEGTYDGGDGIRHYLVSRYSWKHPEQFLYSWGKPFFTFVSSPLSQFGLMGIIVFNILCALVSAYLCYKIARKLKMDYPYLVIIFLCFTPSYFPTINSGLTEPFFGLVLIASIYLMQKENYLWACILVSFLPFVRNEGFFLLPLFFLILIYKRKYLLTLFLGFGTLLYSIIGYFYYKDFLWLINQNPYDGKNKAFYGQGEFLHFVKGYNFLLGSALTILFLLGIASIIIRTFSKDKTSELKNQLSSFMTIENVLIASSFAVYFVAHSVMWWKGLANSLGLLRVLAGVMPCAALICLRGFNLVMIPQFKERKVLEYGIILVASIWIIRSPFKHEYFPYQLNKEEALIQEAGDWFKASPYTKQKVYYLYPYLAHALNVDSFDPNKVGELWGLYPTIKAWGIGAIPDSTIVFWDAHFGPNECQIKIDTLLNDPNFQLLKTFKPAEPFQVLGGYNMEVDVFMKLPKPKELDVLQKDSFDLETLPPALLNTVTLQDKLSYSEKHSCALSNKNEYSVTLKKLVSEISPNTKLLDFTCKILDNTGNSKDAVVVLSVDSKEGKNLKWEGSPIILTELKQNSEWKNCNTKFAFNPSSFPKDAIVKLYVWNKKLKEFYVDDLEVLYLGIK